MKKLLTFSIITILLLLGVGFVLLQQKTPRSGQGYQLGSTRANDVSQKQQIPYDSFEKSFAPVEQSAQ